MRLRSAGHARSAGRRPSMSFSMWPQRAARTRRRNAPLGDRVPSARSVRSVFATTISPDVSLSSRCTSPARSSGSLRRAPAAPLQRVHQRAGPVAGRRMHDHPGGLIDDEQCVVFDTRSRAECSRLRRCAPSVSGTSTAISLPSSALIARFLLYAVDEHCARRNERGRLRAGEVETTRNEQIQPRGVVPLNPEPPRLVHSSRQIVRRCCLSFSPCLLSTEQSRAAPRRS